MPTKTIFLLATTLGFANADPGRNSANYTISHETTTGSTGTRSTSANYAIDATGNTAGGAASSANHAHRDGFAGQLIDVASFDIVGQVNVPETTTRDLDTNIIFDDGTFENDVPAAWSVVSGPLASVSSTGLVTPQIVNLNRPAVVRADYHFGASDTHNMLVIDNDKDNYGSYAGDGLADFWQFVHFGDDNPDAAPAFDPDGDGQDNAFEFLTGHVPTDNASQLTSIITAADTIQLSKALITRSYTLERSTDLVTWTPTGLVLPPNPTVLDQAFTDPNPPIGVRVFYRVVVEN